MGTRGTFGVRIDGEDKFSYNHFDSYPEALGVDVLNDLVKMLEEWGQDKMKEQARKLTFVDDETPPTPEQMTELAAFTVVRVGDQTGTDWYGVLRELQGKIMDTLTVGYAADGNDFIKDSLFCEYGYILNLDESNLEIYRGFQHSPHTLGRYAVASMEEDNIGSKYYPCALVETFSFDNLPTEAQFLEALIEPDEDEED